MNTNFVLSSLLYFDEPRKNYPWSSIGEIKNDKSSPTGLTVRSLNFCNRQTDEFRDILLNLLRDNNLVFSPTISIDYRLLQDDEIIEALRSRNDNSLLGIRIIGDNYKLTAEDINKLSFVPSIFVDECEQEIIENSTIDDGLLTFNNSIIVQQQGLYKKDISFNDSLRAQTDYFITENMSQEDINKVVTAINSDPIRTDGKKLNIRFYNPATYREVLEKLQNAGLNENVTISLMGNPLYDKNMCFSNLAEIVNNEIEIVYNTCQDMVNLYCKEPFTGNNLYISELEGGGKTDLANYSNVLSLLEKTEKHIRDMEYSPLESMVYGYKFLKQNYIYDPDVEQTDEIDYDLNRDLHNIANRDRMVCVGYGTLYSALMRRVGIPTFRYSTNRHVRNITRIKDDKYGIDNIAVCDPTWDCGSADSNLENYTFFLLSPRDLLKAEDPEFITIPTSLILEKDVMDKYRYNSRSPYQVTYNDFYSPDGYTFTMLRLMGYDFDNNWDEFWKQVYKLNDEGAIDTINPDIIKKAVVEVSTREEKNFDYYDEQSKNRFRKLYGQLYDDTVALREYSFPSDNRLLLNYCEDAIERIIDVELIQPRHDRVYSTVVSSNDNDPVAIDSEKVVDDEIEILEDDTEYVAGTNIRKPRNRGIYETDEEYVRYLEEYYTTNFPRYGVQSDGTYRLKKDYIIQDLPINSKDESVFDTIGMSDDEIRSAQENIDSDKRYGVQPDGTYRLKKDYIIQDLPINSKDESVFDILGMSDSEIKSSQESIGSHRR